MGWKKFELAITGKTVWVRISAITAVQDSDRPEWCLLMISDKAVIEVTDSVDDVLQSIDSLENPPKYPSLPTLSDMKIPVKAK